MELEHEAAVADALRQIPEDIFLIEHHPDSPKNSNSSTGPITVQANGRGKIECYQLFPGIELSIHQYRTTQVRLHHRADRSTLEVTHCRWGRIGWNMRGGAVYLGGGDVCLHAADCCADSTIDLPLGYYEGATLSFDLAELERNRPELFEEEDVRPQLLYEKFCSGGKPITILAGEKTERIFSALYDQPSARLLHYKLGALELLLYLIELTPEEEHDLTQYTAQQTEQVREIHDFLIQNPDRRFTIEELAKKHLINTSSLKSVFRAVYGEPIASYMREYRIRRGKMLLRETDSSIAAIAQQLGYGSQGKFTHAFKASTGLLPTEYRRIYRK